MSDRFDKVQEDTAYCTYATPTKGYKMQKVEMGAVWNSALGGHNAPIIKKARKSRITARYEIYVDELGERVLAYSGYDFGHALAIQREMENAKIKNLLREILS